jgi:hypothetical protein
MNYDDLVLYIYISVYPDNPYGLLPHNMTMEELYRELYELGYVQGHHSGYLGASMEAL